MRPIFSFHGSRSSGGMVGRALGFMAGGDLGSGSRLSAINCVTLGNAFTFWGPVSSVKGDVWTKAPSNSGLLDASALLPTADSELTTHTLKGGGGRAPICCRRGRLESARQSYEARLLGLWSPSQDGLC